MALRGCGSAMKEARENTLRLVCTYVHDHTLPHEDPAGLPGGVGTWLAVLFPPGTGLGKMGSVNERTYKTQ